VKAIYMKRLKKLLAKEPETVLSWLETLRKSLFTFNNLRALVIANVEKLPDPVEAWKPLITGMDTKSPLLPLVKMSQRLSPDGHNPGTYGAVIVPMPTIDSSFLLSSARGPTSPTDPIIPSLMVAISFLEAVEGPLWVAVRGKGLAYGSGFKRDPDGGFVQFSVYRSPDAYRAFAAAKAVVESYINGEAKFEQHALEGAISGIVVGFAVSIIPLFKFPRDSLDRCSICSRDIRKNADSQLHVQDEQSTMSTAGQYHFVNGVIKGVDDDYNSRILKAVRDVTVDEIKKVMKDVLMPAFTPGVSNVVVTCAPIMEEVRFPFPSLAYPLFPMLWVVGAYWVEEIMLICFLFSSQTPRGAGFTVAWSISTIHVHDLKHFPSFFPLPYLPFQPTHTAKKDLLTPQTQPGSVKRLYILRLQNTSQAPLCLP
jgi:Zn-dependent M16 (insulinase) family peptidase